ncbi:MAG: DUF418 domain-containing protein [Caldimonas sp.]
MDAGLATAPSPSPGPRPFAPLAGNQRIEALDVVRGFALLGIFLMNIEFFNRPVAALNEGMPRGLTGLDWLASYFVAYFVQGKFWTIFALLFGMGFAVMLVRAERAGREFIKVYLRRILALAVVGAVHFIYLWEGDILFSYAVGALGLLIVLYGRARPIAAAIAALIGLAFVADADPLFALAGGLGGVGLLALYLRGERTLRWRGVSMPVACFLLLLAGVGVSMAALVFWLLPDGPIEPRLPMSVLGPLLLVAGWLAWKYHEPAGKRALRMAVGLYLFGAVTATSMGLAQYFAPDPEAVLATVAVQPATPEAGKARLAAVERATKMKSDREKRVREGAARKAEEVQAVTTGTYLDTVAFRGRLFLEKAADDGVFAMVLVSMFLLGTWFVRSGVMDNTAGHLPFFRKLALYGLPIGIGLGVLGSLIAVSHTPGDRHDGWVINRGLLILGNLPACLGYVGLVVTMLHSRGAASRIRVLAPAGRMALTNYLMQSVICMFVFYGFGLGRWGMPRAEQVLFVIAVYAAQIAFSGWWLARFRYGPMEWLWRSFTYRQVPPLRIAGAF